MGVVAAIAARESDLRTFDLACGGAAAASLAARAAAAAFLLRVAAAAAEAVMPWLPPLPPVPPPLAAEYTDKERELLKKGLLARGPSDDSSLLQGRAVLSQRARGAPI